MGPTEAAIGTADFDPSKAASPDTPRPLIRRLSCARPRALRRGSSAGKYGFSRSIGSGHGEPADTVDGLTDVDRATYPILVRRLRRPSSSADGDEEVRDLLSQQFVHISVRAAQVQIDILAMASSMCTEADLTGVLRQNLLITRQYVEDVVFLIQSVLQRGSAGQIVVR